MQRTYGSSHATLIGLLVDWWVSLSSAHSTFDAPPSWGEGNAGWADAMFCHLDEPVGILEVEGSDPLGKIGTIGRYFDKFQALRFAILLLYSYEPRGKGKERRYPEAENPASIKKVKQLTITHPERSVIVITLDKVFDRITSGIRSTCDYYSGTTCTVSGILFEKGEEQDRKEYLRSA